MVEFSGNGSNRASTGVGQGCRETWVNFLDTAFRPTWQNRQERVHNGTSQSGFYRYDGEGAGTQVQTWLVTVYRPAGNAPNVIRGCLERGANRASTGVATIIRRTSNLVRAGTGCQPADSILRINRGALQAELCQPGFYRCGE